MEKKNEVDEAGTSASALGERKSKIKANLRLSQALGAVKKEVEEVATPSSSDDEDEGENNVDKLQKLLKAAAMPLPEGELPNMEELAMELFAERNDLLDENQDGDESDVGEEEGAKGGGDCRGNRHSESLKQILKTIEKLVLKTKLEREQIQKAYNHFDNAEREIMNQVAEYKEMLMYAQAIAPEQMTKEDWEGFFYEHFVKPGESGQSQSKEQQAGPGPSSQPD